MSTLLQDAAVELRTLGGASVRMDRHQQKVSRRRSTGSSEWKDWLKPRPYRAGDLSHDVSSVWYCDDREEPEDEVWSRNHVSNTPSPEDSMLSVITGDKPHHWDGERLINDNDSSCSAARQDERKDSNSDTESVVENSETDATKLDKFLFLLSHVDSDEEDLDPGKFGLYLDPGVIRLEFDDYPDSVIQQEDSPDFLQPRRDSLGRDWIRRSCEELLDMGKTEKQQENLPTLLTTSLSKLGSLSVGNINLLEDSAQERSLVMDSGFNERWITGDMGDRVTGDMNTGMTGAVVGHDHVDPRPVLSQNSGCVRKRKSGSSSTNGNSSSGCDSDSDSCKASI